MSFMGGAWWGPVVKAAARARGPARIAISAATGSATIVKLDSGGAGENCAPC